MPRIPPPGFHRRHGLMCPLDVLQVITWVAVSLPIIGFFTVQFPVLPDSQPIFWTVLVLFCWICGIFTFALATLSDHPLPHAQSPDHTYKCRYCAEGVPSAAKHCRMCNKCRTGFDHHCRFINNCVTESNYLSFFFGCMFLVSTCYMNLANLFYEIHYFLGHKSDVLARMSSHLHTNTSESGYWVLTSLCILIDLALGAALTVLTVYHIYFQRRSVSTYDYLLKNFTRTPQILQNFCCTSLRPVKITAE